MRLVIDGKIEIEEYKPENLYILLVDARTIDIESLTMSAIAPAERAMDVMIVPVVPLVGRTVKESYVSLEGIEAIEKWLSERKAEYGRTDGKTDDRHGHGSRGDERKRDSTSLG